MIWGARPKEVLKTTFKMHSKTGLLQVCAIAEILLDFLEEIWGAAWQEDSWTMQLVSTKSSYSGADSGSPQAYHTSPMSSTKAQVPETTRFPCI